MVYILFFLLLVCVLFNIVIWNCLIWFGKFGFFFEIDCILIDWYWVLVLKFFMILIIFWLILIECDVLIIIVELLGIWFKVFRILVLCKKVIFFVNLRWIGFFDLYLDFLKRYGCL